MHYQEKYNNPIFFDDISKYLDYDGKSLPKYLLSTLPYNMKVTDIAKYNTKMSKITSNKRKKYTNNT